jgi:alpha-ribazole phosphatase
MKPDVLRLYIVRHGVTAWNQEGRIQGHSDTPLSAEGVVQAQRIGARLARLEPPLQAVWSSDLMRARQTAEAIAAPFDLAVQTTPLLREMMLGEWEGLTQDEIEARGDMALLERYRRDPGQHRPPGGEALEAAWDRVTTAVREIRALHPGGQVAVVGHGGSLRALLCEALNAPVASMLCFSLANASLSIIEEVSHSDHSLRRIRLVNDTSHLT